MKTQVQAGLAFSIVVLLFGCGGGEPPPPKPKASTASKTSQAASSAVKTQAQANAPKSAAPNTGGAKGYPTDKANAALAGTVTYKGKKPRMKPVPGVAGVDPKCAGLHAKKPLRFEWGVVGANGELANALVFISKGLEKYEFDPPAKPVLIEQKGCHYVPHVFGIMAGQKLDIKNDDPTAHNIHSMSEVNPSFNFSQPKQGQVDSKTLDEAESTFLIKCDVHPWMASYCQVFEHPFFAVTGKDGKYEIKGLLPGEYTVTVWHEKWAKHGLSKTVKIGDGETKTQDFTLSRKK